MAIPNINQITSTLRMMGDSALQQYATMHKNDPYILPMAIAESNARKQMRLQAQAKMAMQPQPKVAEKEIAEMSAPTQLPEQQGIAQLPAPNIQSMAGGGIVAFADGGYAEGGMGASEPVIRMSGGGHIPRYQGVPKALGGDGSLVNSLNPLYNVPGMSNITPRASFLQEGAPENQTLFEQISSSLKDQGIQRQIQIIEDRIARGIAGAEEKAYYEQLKAKAAGTPQLAAPKDTVNPDEALLASEKAGKAKPPVDKAPATKDAASAASRTQGAPGGNSGQSIQSMYDLFAGDKNKRDTELNSIQERIRQQGEAETSAAQRQLNQLKADQEAQGPYGKDREAKLKAKEERIGKEEGQAGGLALLEAGLAMMSGTSANAFANIGQGALAGTSAYRKSLDKIADAKDKLDDAYGRLEDVRFNQASMNKSELRKATADVDKAANAGLKSLTDFAVTRYGISEANAKTMFTGAMQERVANIGAGATIGAAQIRSKDNDKYLETIKGSSAIEQARKNVMEQVIKSNKYGTPEQIQTQFEKEWEKTLQLNPALAKLAGASGGGSTPAGGADFVLNPQTGKLEPRK